MNMKASNLILSLRISRGNTKPSGEAASESSRDCCVSSTDSEEQKETACSLCSRRKAIPLELVYNA